MDSSELLDLIDIKEELIPQGKKNRPGTRLHVKKVTIHNTSNDDPGADARAHSNFVRNKGYYTLPNGKKQWVSWHYTVDDSLAIRHVPDNEVAWHVNREANTSSLGVEICMHKEINQQAANERAARLAAFLLYSHNLDIDDLRRHFDWTGKKCPTLILTDVLWGQFKDRVSAHLGALRGQPDARATHARPPFVFRGEDCVEDDQDQ